MSRKLVYSTQCASGCAKSRKRKLGILAKLRERTSRIHVSHRDKYDEVKKQFCRSFIRICIVLFTWLYSTGTVKGIRIDCYSIFTVCKFNDYSDWKLKYAAYCKSIGANDVTNSGKVMVSSGISDLAVCLRNDVRKNNAALPESNKIFRIDGNGGLLPLPPETGDRSKTQLTIIPHPATGSVPYGSQ